jgi:tetratricopeptide (TPR) repeat protein
MDAVDIATLAGTVIAGAGLIYAALTYHKRHQRPGPRPFRPVSRRLRRPTHPPVANPRPQPTARFTGRVEPLAHLARALRRERLVVVHGLGGVGKTQLVLHYLERHARDYQVVWWIRADQPTTLAGDLARLAAALHLPEQDHPDQEVIIDAVRGWLQRHPGWLLIFDNVEDEPTLTRFLPALGDRRGGRVLVTTRYDLWRDAATVPVRPWSRAEAVAFLRRSLPAATLAAATPGEARQVDGRLAELAGELGDLPLALEQAAAYLHQTKTTLADYLEAVRTRGLELFAAPGEQRTVATVWSLSLERLAATPGAAALLALCAYLAPDNIPRALLTVPAEDGGKLLARLPEPLQGVAGDPVAAGRALGALGAYSLVTLDERTVGVHRLVQAVVRDQHRTHPGSESAVPAPAWAAAAVELVAAVFPPDSGEVANWPVCERLLPHALAAAAHAEHRQIDPKATIGLLDGAASYLHRRGRYAEAQPLFERALAISKASLAPDDPTTAVCLSDLATIEADLGRLKRARELYEQALAARRRVFGVDQLDHPDHPDHPEHLATLQLMNSLAEAHRDLGELQDARDRHEESLAAHRRVLRDHPATLQSIDHPATLQSMNNLAATRAALGDLQGARELYEQTVAGYGRLLGYDRPATLNSMINLATIQADLGAQERARESYEPIVDAHQRVLGDDRPATLNWRNNLAAALAALGDLQGARHLHEQTLATRRRVLGNDHPDTLQSMSNLAATRAALGDYQGARDLHEQTLTGRRRVLGEDHPNALTSMSNLATTLAALGDLQGARDLHEQALAARRDVLGKDHPTTLTSMGNLAETRRALGDLQGARHLHEQTLDTRRQMLGNDHPDTLQSIKALAAVRRELGEL